MNVDNFLPQIPCVKSPDSEREKMNGNASLLMKMTLMLAVVFGWCACDRGKLKPVVCIPTGPEICNGIDDDCNGQIDENLTTDCSNACGKGTIECLNGKIQPCSAPKPGPVDIPCNGIDDDCDGQIDNINVVACYPGDIQHDLSHTYSECRFGIEVVDCSTGQTSCAGWKGPSPEICDGKDNNCNGQIDEGLPTKALDIVLALDESQSMAVRIQGLIGATVNWAKKYQSRTNLRFILVLVPSRNPALDGRVTLEQNSSSAQDFINVLALQGDGNTGAEPTVDGVYMISSPANPLGITWTPGAKKIIIIYSDENPQSFQMPPVTEQMAIDEAQANSVSVYVFTSETFLTSWSSWNSKTFSPPNSSLESELDKIISDNSCPTTP